MNENWTKYVIQRLGERGIQVKTAYNSDDKNALNGSCEIAVYAGTLQVVSGHPQMCLDLIIDCVLKNKKKIASQQMIEGLCQEDIRKERMIFTENLPRYHMNLFAFDFNNGKAQCSEIHGTVEYRRGIDYDAKTVVDSTLEKFTQCYRRSS
jgi:hypothetical protein